MAKRKKHLEPLPKAVLVEFCDHSSSLDRRFLLVGHLVQGLESDPLSWDAGELGEVIFDYLGNRAALEHVYLGRHLAWRWARDLRWKSEIWRLEKIKARTKLLKRCRA